MDEDIIFGLENFRDLWQRVAGNSYDMPPAQTEKSGDLSVLAGLIDVSREVQSFYVRLINSHNCPFKYEIRALLKVERECEKALSLQYFLLAGERYRADNRLKCCVRIRRLDIALRTAIQKCANQRESFITRAKIVENPELEKLFIQQADIKLQQLEKLKKLLFRIM